MRAGKEFRDCRLMISFWGRGYWGPKRQNACAWTNTQQNSDPIFSWCSTWHSVIISCWSCLSSLQKKKKKIEDMWQEKATPFANYKKVIKCSHLKFIPWNLKVKCKQQKLTMWPNQKNSMLECTCIYTQKSLRHKK